MKQPTKEGIRERLLSKFKNMLNFIEANTGVSETENLLKFIDDEISRVSFDKELKYCKDCVQMTNHKGEKCLKCPRFKHGKYYLLKHVNPEDRIVVGAILDTLIEDVEDLTMIAYKKKLMEMYKTGGLEEVLNEIQS